jgi:hypothetical protein
VIRDVLAGLEAGGPWAACLLLLGAYFWARHRGWLLTEKEVERTIQGYRDTNAFLEKELGYQREANGKKDSTIQTQADQIARLMSGAELSTRTVEAIVEEARKRGLGA